MKRTPVIYPVFLFLVLTSLGLASCSGREHAHSLMDCDTRGALILSEEQEKEIVPASCYEGVTYAGDVLEKNSSLIERIRPLAEKLKKSKNPDRIRKEILSHLLSDDTQDLLRETLSICRQRLERNRKFSYASCRFGAFFLLRNVASSVLMDEPPANFDRHLLNVH